MDSIRDFIFADAGLTPEQTAEITTRSVARVSEALRSGDASIHQLLEQISVYTLDRKHSPNRKQAYLLLDKVLGGLPTEFLGSEDFLRLFTLFLRSLEADTEHAVNILSLLRTLQTHFAQAENHNLVRMLTEFFENNKFSTILYTFEVRNSTYRLLLDAFNRYYKAPIDAEWVRMHQERIIRAIVGQTEGEKDPRNLILVLEIWTVVFGHFESESLSKTAKEVFDSLAVYFPITIDDVQNKILVNKQYMVESLNECLAAPHTLPFFLDLILEKLEEQNKEENEATLHSLGLLFGRETTDVRTTPNVHLVAQKLGKKLNFLLFEVTDQSIEATTKEAYKAYLRFVLRTLRDSLVVDWRTQILIKEILDAFIAQIVKKPNGKNAHAAIEVLVDALANFDSDILLHLITKIAIAFGPASEKPSTLVVYCESVLPVLIRCVFHPLFAKLCTNDCKLVSSLNALRGVNEKHIDQSHRLTLLKAYCVCVRVCPSLHQQSLKLPEVEETVFINSTVAALARNSDYFRNSTNDSQLKFEAAITLNLDITPEIKSHLFLEAVLSFVNTKDVSDAKTENFTNLSSLFLKSLKKSDVPKSLEAEKVRLIVSLVSDRSPEGRGSLEQVIIRILLEFYRLKEMELYRLIGAMQAPNLLILGCLLQCELSPKDKEELAEDLHRLEPKNKRNWSVFATAVDKGIWKMDSRLIQKLESAQAEPRITGPVVCHVIKQNFASNSKTIAAFLERVGASSGPALLSSYISEVLLTAESPSFTTRTPLFRQKLAQFLDKLADEHLKSHQFEHISAKLSLVNFGIASGTAEQPQTEALNSQFLDFAIRSGKNADVHLKYLTLMQHLISQQTVDCAALISEAFLRHFVAVSSDSEFPRNLHLHCSFIQLLEALLSRPKLVLPPPLLKSISIFLRGGLGHRKRVIRQIAANAINTNAISRFTDSQNN